MKYLENCCKRLQLGPESAEELYEFVKGTLLNSNSSAGGGGGGAAGKNGAGGGGGGGGPGGDGNAAKSGKASRGAEASNDITTAEKDFIRKDMYDCFFFFFALE